MYTLIDDIAIIPGVITVNEKSHCDKRTLLLWRQAGCFANNCWFLLWQDDMVSPLFPRGVSPNNRGPSLAK